MLRYATIPTPDKKKNASANPAAIFRPNVHMSSLLRTHVHAAPLLNRFSETGNADEGTNHAVRAHQMLDAGTSHILMFGCVNLRPGAAQIALKIAAPQGHWLLGSAQSEPASSLGFNRIAKE